MFKNKLLLLAATLSAAAFAEYVHDLDDEDHLNEISMSGIILSNQNK